MRIHDGRIGEAWSLRMAYNSRWWKAYKAAKSEYLPSILALETV